MQLKQGETWYTSCFLGDRNNKVLSSTKKVVLKSLKKLSPAQLRSEKGQDMGLDLKEENKHSYVVLCSCCYDDAVLAQINLALRRNHK